MAINVVDNVIGIKTDIMITYHSFEDPFRMAADEKQPYVCVSVCACVSAEKQLFGLQSMLQS